MLIVKYTDKLMKQAIHPDFSSNERGGDCEAFYLDMNLICRRRGMIINMDREV